MKTEAIQEHKSKDITGHHGSWTVATNISLAVWFEGQLDSKAQLGGRHLEPTDAGTLTPRSRPPASLVTEVLSSKELGGGPCDKDRTGKVKGMETEVQPGLRVTRHATLPASQASVFTSENKPVSHLSFLSGYDLSSLLL